MLHPPRPGRCPRGVAARRSRLLFSPLARLFVGITLAFGSGCAPSSEEVVLDQRSVPYIEDEPQGRPLAGVEARLVRRAREAHLSITLSADGTWVAPIPGFQGTRGANRITARELGRVVREGRLEVLSVARDGSGANTVGSARITRTGSVPERRLYPDGRIDFDARSAEEHALEIALDCGSFGVGRWQTDVVVGHRTRLRIHHSFDGVEGRIEEIDCHPVPVPEELHP